MRRKALKTGFWAVAALLAGWAALTLSGYGIIYSARQIPVGPYLGEAGRLIAVEVHYFDGRGSFRAIYPQGFGAPNVQFVRHPPSPAEEAQFERWLKGED